MNLEKLRTQTEKCVLRISEPGDAVPAMRPGTTLVVQTACPARSMAQNNCVTWKARPGAEFITRLGIAKATDESRFWLERLLNPAWPKPNRVESVQKDMCKLIVIITALRKSVTRAK